MHIQDFYADPSIRHILHERAKNLASSVVEDNGFEQGDELLTFRLGDGGYSVPAQFIREVHPLGSCTRLPMTPSFVVGLVNVRGKILTALDIRPLLNIAQTPLLEESFLVIVGTNEAALALLADSVVEVQHMESEVTPALSAVAGQGTSWVQGIDQHLNVVIDLPQMLADPRLVVQDETV